MKKFPGLALSNENIDKLTQFVITDSNEVTPERSELVEKLNHVLEEATFAALNEGCFKIQKSMGIDHGDVAGAHFSGSENKDEIQACLADYFMLELTLAANASEDEDTE